jgi:hypothetical protein
MKSAFPFMDHIQGYTYGVGLVTAGRPKEAFQIFKMIYEKFPNTLFTNIGIAIGYSALCDHKKR